LCGVNPPHTPLLQRLSNSRPATANRTNTAGKEERRNHESIDSDKKSNSTMVIAFRLACSGVLVEKIVASLRPLCRRINADWIGSRVHSGSEAHGEQCALVWGCCRY